MFAKPLLKATASLFALAALTLAGCATPSANSPAPSAESAAAYVDAAEAELAARSEYENRIAWVYQTYINYDTEWLQQRADAERIAQRVRLASGTAQFRDVAGLDPGVARRLGRLRLAITLPAPQRDGAADELAAITTRLSSIYSTGRIDYRGEEKTLDELETMMGEVRDPAGLEEMWTDWHDTARPMREDYARMVEIANEGARDLGFSDVGEMWLSNYDMPAADMEREVERLWGQLQPFYEQLQCHVRAELNARYGDAIVPLNQPIRADLLGNMWAQDWTTLYPIVGPGESDRGYDLTQLLVAANYDERRMVEVGERFYTSLGLDPLPQTFWERSLLARPRDRDVVCHASAWDLDDQEDIRIKQCIQINADHFETVHHELGHNYYQRAYRNQSFLYLDGAHDGFHEAIGDFIALNATPEYLAQIDLLPRNRIPNADADTGLLMERALGKIAFLPFALSLDQWRWRVFRGEITPETYNTAWWEIRERYQGVRPPSDRPADAFDPGAKYHIANNVPYLRYFLSFVLQFQFYQAACEQAGWEGPLHRCTVYGNQEVGRRFNAMMEMGASRPWPEALEAFTGTREMDGAAMVAYFQPLNAWLEEQNRGRTCGW